jgi:hypothetical protein
MGELARLKLTALAIVTAAGAAALGCAGAAAAPGTEPQPVLAMPLGVMASRPVVVLPIQYIVFPDSLPFRRQLPPSAQFLIVLDDSIAMSLGDRGLRSWTFAPAITASARRNMGMTADPHALAAERLRRLVKAGDDPVSEPLASQIRSLVALRDARYVILPSIIRIERREAGARGALLLYLIDTRTSRITWSGEVDSDASRSFTTIAGSLAQRVADLVAAR